jgi:hypothetical protein
MKSATVDGRRRLLMPPECPPGSAVTIQELDKTTWLVKRQVPSRKFKLVVLPVIDRLPDDPELEMTELAFAKHAARKVSPFEELTCFMPRPRTS